MDLNGTEPVVQILPKGSLLDHLLQGPMSCSNHPDVDHAFLAGSHGCESFGFQHSQQLDLNIKRKLSQFIQEERSTISLFKHANPGVRGPGEGTTCVTEEHALRQACMNGSAVDRDEWTACPRTVIVEVVREDFLTSPSRPADEHRAS